MNGLGAYLPKESTQHWANGCEKCNRGIVSAPELTGACETYLERLVQAVDGDITFCECKAGIRYRVFLLNRYRFLVEEAKRDERMKVFAAKKSHPDIEAARNSIAQSYGMLKAPPIHWVNADGVETPEQEQVPA